MGDGHMNKPETLKLIRTTLTEVGGKITVEMLYAENPDPEPEPIGLAIRLPIEHEYPLIPEAELEALRRVRTLAAAEIQRIERKRNPSS